MAVAAKVRKGNVEIDLRVPRDTAEAEISATGSYGDEHLPIHAFFEAGNQTHRNFDLKAQEFRIGITQQRHTRLNRIAFFHQFLGD